ncbi:MAG: tetratricopeptide repeat protein, partial [Acidobacteriota bacterium]
LLYLLLSGRHPYYQRQMQNPALMQAVLLDDPVPPSRAADPAVGEAVAGDLDMITLKALQKLPENRYDSAAQLAEEIQLHLEDLPIRAWPGTWRSRLRKAVRRNRLLTATAAFLLLFSGTVTFLWRYAVGQEAEARRAQARSERIQSFTLDFFESIEPDRLRGEAPDIKQIVDRGREKIEQSLHDEPSVRADILGSLAVIYDALALHEEALELQKEAVEHRRSLRPVDPRVMAVDLNNLASSYYGRDEFDRAELFFRESLPYWRDLEHPYEINAMANLAGVVGRQDRALEAIEIYRAALERAGALGLEETSHAAAAHFGLGVAQHRMGDSAGAEEHLRRAHLIYSLETATKPSKLAQVESSLGEVLQARGDLEAARLYLKSALATRLTIFGQKHARTAGLQEKLALLLIELGETAAAEELLQKAGDAYTALGNEDDASRIRKIAGPLTGPSLAAK